MSENEEGENETEGLKQNLSQSNSKKCELCNENIRVGVKCVLCPSVAHRKCVDKLKTTNPQANWACNACSRKVNMVSVDSLIKELGALRKENDILNKLLEEKDRVNQLLTEKLNKLEQINCKVTSQNTDIRSDKEKISYSQAVSKTIVIKPTKEGNNRATDIKSEFKKAMDTVSMNLKIENTKILSNGGLAVNCDEKSYDLIKTNLESNLGSEYSIKLAQKINPKIYIHRAEMDHLTHKKDDEIIDEIIQKNDLTSYRKDEMKIIRKIKKSGYIDLILSVSADIRRKLIACGYMYLGYKKCSLSDSFHALRCYNCSTYGHSYKDCKKSVPTCPVCCGNHILKECKADRNMSKCVNCQNYNDKHQNSEVNVRHAALDRNCPSYKNIINIIKQRTDL